jgi:hypothetical protein
MTTITAMQEQKLLEFSEGLLWSVRHEPYSEIAFRDICKILYLKIVHPKLLYYNFFEDGKQWTFSEQDTLLGKHIDFGISRSSFEALLLVLEKFHWCELSIQQRGFFFETFMNHFLIKEGKRYKKDLAIAPVIVDYIIDILAPKAESLILNPDCGAGDFVVKVNQYINAMNVFALDVDSAVCQLARLNLWMHGMHYKIYKGSLHNFDERIENQVDIILGISIHDINSTCKFLEKCLKCLKAGGKMSIILTEDFLISDSNESKSIRSYIKDKAKIFKITALPQNAFYNTTFKTSILFFQKFTEKQKYDFEENLNEGNPNNYRILYADIKRIGMPSPIPYFRSKENQLLLLAQEYKNYKPNTHRKNETLLEETAYGMLGNWSISYLKNQMPKTNAKYPQRTLYELIDKNNKSIIIDESTEYKRVTVRSSDKGVELRDIVRGKDIKRKRQFVIKEGQLIIAKLNPTSGAVGIVPPDLDNAITTDEFSTYTVKKEIVLPEYLVLLFSSPSFTNYLNTLTTGTVMLRLRETLFLKIAIPLPTLQEQIELCQKIMSLKPEIKRLQDNLIQEKKIFENKIFKT